MEKKRFKFVIPVMVIVAIGSVYMLRNYYAEVPDLDQLFITICATLVSGVLAYFLFPQQGEGKIDDRGPY
ncbi:accessory gene regulator B family protein [Lysinibacillus sp. CTST325]